MKDKRLRDKVAIVTGGGRGIGYATAVEMWREGARVFVADLPERGLPATELPLERVPVDLTEPGAVSSLMERVVSKAGALDVLVNNAGLLLSRLVQDVTREDWSRLMAVNLEAVFFASREAASMMSKRNGGAIVNIASTSAFVASGGQAVYEASKAGVAMLTRSMAVEMAPDNIRVNAVAPGLIETEMTRSLFGSQEKLASRVREKVPLNRAGTPEDIAKAIVFLVSEDASFIYGETLVVDGGWLLS